MLKRTIRTLKKGALGLAGNILRNGKCSHGAATLNRRGVSGENRTECEPCPLRTAALSGSERHFPTP